jgi:hypothetical protein
MGTATYVVERGRERLSSSPNGEGRPSDSISFLRGVSSQSTYPLLVKVSEFIKMRSHFFRPRAVENQTPISQWTIRMVDLLIYIIL